MSDPANIFNSLIDSFGRYLPVTVISALLLFLFKEFLEANRRRRSEQNKLKAISFILSEEIKLNYWAFKTLFRTFEELGQLFERYPNAVYNVKETRFREEIYQYKERPEDQVWSGHPLPRFVSDRFNTLLPSLAELDLKLSGFVQDTYQEIAELEHYRQMLVSFLANELHEDETFNDLTKAFIKDFSEEESDYFAKLNKSYRELTGKELKEWRLR